MRSVLHRWGPVVAALIPFALFVARFDFVTDDAFISFRYARNLAQGHGLVFNPGEVEPVEGFSNLLWVLAMAVVELAGGRPDVVARVLSVLCGAALLVVVARALERARVGPGARTGALLFLATLPPLTLWSTGGLATVPAALALFAAADAVVGHASVRVRRALLVGALALLLRADAHLFLTLALVAAGVEGIVRGERDQLARIGRTALGWGVVFAALTAWRFATFGDWLPHTARVKVGFTTLALERGLDYAVVLLLTVPALLLLLPVPWLLLGRNRSRWASTSAVMFLGTALIAVVVGGDFMAMGRLFVPGLAFAAVALGLLLERVGARSRIAGVALAVVAVALSIPAAGDVSLVPESVRARFHFRWNTPNYVSEVRQWELMRTRVLRWTALGKALRDHTPRDASLVGDAIGCVGYYSERTVYDLFGLTDRRALAASGPQERRSPGHDRRVRRDFFFDRAPTYVEVDLIPAQQRWRDFPPYWSNDPGAMARLTVEWIPLSVDYGCPPGSALRLVGLR